MLFGGDGTTTTDFRFCFLKLREAQTEDASMWPSWLLFSPSASVLRPGICATLLSFGTSKLSSGKGAANGLLI